MVEPRNQRAGVQPLDRVQRAVEPVSGAHVELIADATAGGAEAGRMQGQDVGCLGGGEAGQAQPQTDHETLHGTASGSAGLGFGSRQR